VERNYEQLRGNAAAAAALAHADASSGGTRRLTDDEALFLLEFTHNAVGLACAAF
jgi:hypothetical protein